MRLDPHSLQFHLAWRLGLVFVLATAAVAGAVWLEATETAAKLEREALQGHASQIANHLTVNRRGTVRVALAAPLGGPAAPKAFAVRAAETGEVLAAHPQWFGEALKSRSAPRSNGLIRLQDLGPDRRSYKVWSLTTQGPTGPVRVAVARAVGTETLTYTLIEEFLLELAWLIPVIAVAALVVVMLGLHRGLRPLRQVATLAARIGPERTDLRLPEANLPSELRPLVSTVNRGLDRLDAAFVQQRRFTADAAHQLRTPLAVLTANLEALDEDERVAALRDDVARMNRLLDQLLRVARLDATSLEVSEQVDLMATAQATVATMAPLAVRLGRELVLAGAGNPVYVRGNAEAIDDALRNLIENALTHTPSGSTVTVTVSASGAVAVKDQGPGLPVGARDHLFERFWRAPNAPAQGAGLGLAIVAEIMRAHGGQVKVEDNPGGGAVFTLAFRLVA